MFLTASATDTVAPEGIKVPYASIGAPIKTGGGLRPLRL
jgi:hypothetical protein